MYICTGVAGAVSGTQRPLCSPSCCQSSQTSIWPFSCELMAHGNSNSWTAVHGTLWKQQHRKNVLIKMCLRRKKLERSEFHWETILSAFVLPNRGCLNQSWCERRFDCSLKKQYSFIVDEGLETVAMPSRRPAIGFRH